MAKHVYADADHRASGRTRARRRNADLAFLASLMELRDARDLTGLVILLRQHDDGPEWRLVAIKRAIKHVVMR